MKSIKYIYLSILLTVGLSAQVPLTFNDYNVGVSPTITCFGDSLMAGTGGTSPCVQLWYRLPNRIFNNYSIGGQVAAQVAARQGGYPIKVTLSGDAWASGYVDITSINVQFLSTPADNTTRAMGGIINGTPAYIRRQASGGPPSTSETYDIQNMINLSSGTVTPTSIFYPDDGFNSRHDIQLLWMGRNNVGGASLFTVPSIIDGCVQYISKPRRFLVIGVLPALDEIIGTQLYADIAAVNATIQSNYPSNFIPSTPPTADEMASIGYTPSPQDLIDIANGVFPTGMHADNVHLNYSGYAIFALRMYNKFVYLGWD